MVVVVVFVQGTTTHYPLASVSQHSSAVALVEAVGMAGVVPPVVVVVAAGVVPPVVVVAGVVPPVVAAGVAAGVVPVVVAAGVVPPVVVVVPVVAGTVVVAFFLGTFFFSRTGNAADFMPVE